MKQLLFVILCFLPVAAMAGGDEGVFDRGNGGDVVICGTGPGQTHEVLDMHEFPRWGFLPVEFSGNGGREVLGEVLHRIGLQYPYVEKALQHELEVFWKEVAFVPASSIPEVNDEGGYQLKEGCILKQLAVQWSENSSQGRRYLIAADYWGRLDSRNQAALLIHEMMYRLLVRSQVGLPASSSELRVYVAFFFSQELLTVSQPIELPPAFRKIR
ncbi:hypothetical protein ACNQKP_08050 [Bdellovibrio bacteriovorus]|uniref:hypothetical protein n=1 Tax=Bdellovibrio bacteriovorus TaxID=959 RepID=UPI003AA8A888